MNTRCRLVRVLVVAGAVVGMAVPAPPASATTVTVAVFTGSTTLGGPISLPNPTDFLPDPVVPPTQHCGLPLPQPLLVPDPMPQCHFNWGGHIRGVTALLSTTTCIDLGVNVAKAGKSPAQAGTCAFLLAPPKAPEGNHVHGFCGLNGGQVQTEFRDALAQSFALDVHFDTVGAVMVLRGHWRKFNGQTGTLHGLVLSVPVPLLPGLGNSCLTGTTVFFANGVVSLISHV